MATGKMSPAYRLIHQVWHHSKARSWLRTNSSMSTAIGLAVDAVMDFARDDMRNIGARMSGAYWLHLEPLYSRAVEAGNLSACKSIEHALDRRPWVIGSRRIAVGTETPWGIVTSITDAHFTACTYAHGRRDGKPLKRNRVTREMVADENRGERRARAATVTCPSCVRTQPDHRTGSAWAAAGKRKRYPDDNCDHCRRPLPKIKAAA